MTEERSTETRTPEGNTHTHTHTTVITDQPRSGGASKWIGLVILLVLGVVAVLVFSRMTNSDTAKNNAVADAATSVGQAAEKTIDEVSE